MGEYPGERMTMEQVIKKYEDRIVILTDYDKASEVGTVHTFAANEYKEAASFVRGLIKGPDKVVLDPRLGTKFEYDPWDFVD